MRKLVIALLLGSALIVPAAASAASRPAYERAYLAHYDQLRARHGVDAPGCNLLVDRYHNRCDGKVTPRKVKRSDATLKRMLFVPKPAPVVKPMAAPVVRTSSYSSTTSTATTSTYHAPPVASAPAQASSGGGCGDLPGYIVQRESGGNPNARNGRYGGCAQVDDAHFSPGGACAGLGYIACVNKLWDHGRGAHNWPTAANPPG
jgi:hypothetical protein